MLLRVRRMYRGGPIMAVRLRQPLVGGGEYDPGLWGRQDLGRYGTSGRLVRNWIVRATGGLETRPGSRFIGEVKNSAKPARVLPFQVTEALGYLVVANGGVFQLDRKITRLNSSH